ncbi:hypothetical protein [Mesorhizobium captivum]|uniref:hypothetical protein n=1 Tax=Mesorhizobium captivum TaxID=3072319 RepID=UPI003D316268
MAEQTDNLRDPPLSGARKGKRSSAAGRRTFVVDISDAYTASDSAEVHRHGFALHREILKAAVEPAMPISGPPSAIGQMPNAGPAAETTQLSSSVSETPRILTPGPGDHFVFVRMPAHSGTISNGE